jgi:hypothetical protein
LSEGVEKYSADIQKLSQEDEVFITSFLNGTVESTEYGYMKNELNRLFKNLVTPDFRNRLPYLANWNAKEILQAFAEFTSYKLQKINSISSSGFKETSIRIFPNNKQITECTNPSFDFFTPLTTFEDQVECSKKTKFAGTELTLAYDQENGKHPFTSGFVHTVLVTPLNIKYSYMNDADYNYSLGLNYAFIYSHEDWHARFATINGDLERTFTKGSKKYKIMESLSSSGDGEHVIMYSIQTTQKLLSSYRRTSNVLFPDFFKGLDQIISQISDTV